MKLQLGGTSKQLFDLDFEIRQDNPLSVPQLWPLHWNCSKVDSKKYQVERCLMWNIIISFNIEHLVIDTKQCIKHSKWCHFDPNSFSFLGITIAEKLSWPSHITTLVENESKEKAFPPKEKASCVETSNWTGRFHSRFKPPRTPLVSIYRASLTLFKWDVCTELKEYWNTTPTSATVCSPCCHLTEVSAAVPPDYVAASFSGLRLLNSSPTPHFIKGPVSFYKPLCYIWKNYYKCTL